MTTVAKIISLAMKDAGIIGAGETASADDASDALDTLNQMLAQWQISSLAVYVTAQVSFNLTGAQSYTMGAIADIVTARPKEVLAAFWRDGANDTPLEVITSALDYQGITSKTSAGTPSCVFYSPTYPLGTLYAHPVGSSGAIHLTVSKPFGVYASTADDLALPAEYELAVRFNLAVLLGATFARPVRADIADLARNSMRLIKRNNTTIPTMQMPAHLGGGRSFDIASGQ